MKQKKYMEYAWLIICILVIGFMHLYRLVDVPYGLNVDEAGAAYDALCIARFGVDRYLNSWPVYFVNFGDGQNALYIYMLALSFKIFGVSKWAIRIPMVLVSFVAAFFGCKYIQLKWPKTNRYLVFLTMYALVPVFTMMHRFGLESHLMFAGGMISLYYSAKALSSGKALHYLLAGLAFGVTLYSYALSYIVIPICLVLMLVYAIRIGKINWKGAFAFALPLAILALPLIGVQLINYFDLPGMRIGPFTLPKLYEYRTNELSRSTFFGNIWSVLKNTLGHDDLAYNTLGKFGALFYVSIPFILVGLFVAIKNTILACKEKKFDTSVPVLCWLVGELVMGGLLTGNSDPNSTRLNGIYVCWAYFLVIGILFVFELCKKTWQKWSFSVGVACVYVVGFLFFATYYFGPYNEDVFPLKWLFFESYDEVVEVFDEYEDEAWTKRGTCYNWPYVYYLLANEVDPHELGDLYVDYVEYKNDHINQFPNPINLDDNYVVYKSDASSIELLKELSYDCYETEHYYIFVSPMERFTETEGEACKLVVDTKKFDHGQIMISGWCTDEVTGKAFASLSLSADNKAKDITQLERHDVAVTAGGETLMSGFGFSLSKEEFAKLEELTLIGTREDGSQATIMTYTKR